MRLSIHSTIRAFLIPVISATIACSGDSSNPAGPGGTSSSSSGSSSSGSSSSGAGVSCRTYATAYTTTSSANGRTLASNIPNLCSFDTSTNQITCTIGFGGGGPICSKNIVSWNSRADFVDEIQSIPARELDLMATSAQIPSGPCGPGNTTSTRTNTYDSQRRITRVDVSNAATTTYSAWDSKGRPTSGSTGGMLMTFVYDDAARTVTLTTGAGSSAAVSTLTYDANGILVQEVVQSGGFTTTTTHTIQTTAQVCK